MDEFKEKTVEEFGDDKYEELVGKYIEYREKEKFNKELKDIIATEIDQMLHLEQKDYKKVYITAVGENYECKYVDRNTKKVDYVRLAEVVSDEIFEEIVGENTSTYLKISAEAKKKEKRERPIPKAPEIKATGMPKAKLMK